MTESQQSTREVSARQQRANVGKTRVANDALTERGPARVAIRNKEFSQNSLRRFGSRKVSARVESAHVVTRVSECRNQLSNGEFIQRRVGMVTEHVLLHTHVERTEKVRRAAR